MKSIVVSQPMFFPWVGLFEQILLADIFVHYDDVQLPLGRSFSKRVQVKTKDGVNWLSVPVEKGKHLIKDCEIEKNTNWRQKHLEALRHYYGKLPFYKEMNEIVEEVYEIQTNKICDLNIASLELISRYFEINIQFLKSSNLDIEGKGSDRLHKIMKFLKGDVYITGHGAKNYLDHELFEKSGMSVRYMDYRCAPYPQSHPPFTPYVTILDLIANVGKSGRKYLVSGTRDWKEFVNASEG